MAKEQKITDKVAKLVQDDGAELRYLFLVSAKDNKLEFVSHVHSAELHATIGMLERAKMQLLKRMEDM